MNVDQPNKYEQPGENLQIFQIALRVSTFCSFSSVFFVLIFCLIVLLYLYSLFTATLASQTPHMFTSSVKKQVLRHPPGLQVHIFQVHFHLYI